MVLLDAVPYGTKGPFAINVWVKVSSLSGSQFEYVFSHNSTVPETSSWGPNQVQPISSLVISDESQKLTSPVSGRALLLWKDPLMMPPALQHCRAAHSIYSG